MNGDGVADVVANSAGQDRRMIGIIDGQTNDLRCQRFENGRFAESFTVGNILPEGGLEIAAARPNSNNPMVRLMNANCQNINNRGIPGSLGFRARGALSSIDGFFGVAVADPAPGLGSIRIYQYTDNRRNGFGQHQVTY